MNILPTLLDAQAQGWVTAGCYYFCLRITSRVSILTTARRLQILENLPKLPIRGGPGTDLRTCENSLPTPASAETLLSGLLASVTRKLFLGPLRIPLGSPSSPDWKTQGRKPVTDPPRIQQGSGFAGLSLLQGFPAGATCKTTFVPRIWGLGMEWGECESEGGRERERCRG